MDDFAKFITGTRRAFYFYKILQSRVVVRQRAFMCSLLSGKFSGNSMLRREENLKRDPNLTEIDSWCGWEFFDTYFGQSREYVHLTASWIAPANHDQSRNQPNSQSGHRPFTSFMTSTAIWWGLIGWRVPPVNAAHIRYMSQRVVRLCVGCATYPAFTKCRKFTKELLR